MTVDRDKLVKALFDQGFELDEAAREALLAQNRAHDPQLAAMVRELWRLEADPPEKQLFDSLTENVMRSLAEESFPSVAGYQIVQKVGSGGMGVVYRAKQEGPLQRDVALKVLGKAAVGAEYLARFQLEQQALSLMEQTPYVARVYDAGLTQTGAPYYTMEFLNGESITDYCDIRKLDVATRLRLFMMVCEGVAHAHQKGVIHRDLKPSNVLVVELEGKPFPKIIDFGIAKLEKTPRRGRVFETQAGSLVGTLGYMSPETVLDGPHRADTRSDIYTLGIMLYELLSGETPFDDHQAQISSLRGLVNLFENFRPPPPSTRGDEAAAAARGLSRQALTRKLRGELDAIVLQAVAANPKHRYSSCSELRRDLSRYLNGLPVEAVKNNKPFYLLRKFLRRHRLAVMFATGAATALVTGFIAVYISLQQTEKALAELTAVTDFNEALFRQANPYQSGLEVKVVDLLSTAEENLQSRYADRPELQGSMQLVIGRTYEQLGLYRKAVKQLEPAYRLLQITEGPYSIKTLRAGTELAFTWGQLGEAKRAEPLAAHVERQLSKRHPSHKYTFTAGATLASLLHDLDRLQASKTTYEDLFSRLQQFENVPRDMVAITHINYARLLKDTGDFQQAEALLKQSIDWYRQNDRENHPLIWSALHSLGEIAIQQKNYHAAVAFHREAYNGKSRSWGVEHKKTLTSLNSLANATVHQFGPRAAVVLLQRYLGEGEKPLRLGRLKPLLVQTYAHVLMASGAGAEAETLLNSMLNSDDGWLPTYRRLQLRCTLAENYHRMKQWRAAQSAFEQLLSEAENYFEASSSKPWFYRGLYALMLADRGEEQRAKQMLAECIAVLEQLNMEGHPTTVQLQQKLQTLTTRALE